MMERECGCSRACECVRPAIRGGGSFSSMGVHCTPGEGQATDVVLEEPGGAGESELVS